MAISEMKYNFLIPYLIAFAQVKAQVSLPGPKPLDSDDPKGLRLPPGVPRMVDANSNVVWLDINFTTQEYQKAASKLLVEGANSVARQLQLSDEIPITISNVDEVFVNPFGYKYIHKKMGTVTTRNYCYYFSEDNKFCYLEGTHQESQCQKFQEQYTWPISKEDKNQAYQLATQWLSNASMDVAALNRDSHVTIEPDPICGQVAKGKFVPVYYVSWANLASVRVFTPEGIILQLRVEDPKYILRKPLEFTNLNSLFPGVAPVWTLPPPTLGLPPNVNN